MIDTRQKVYTNLFAYFQNLLSNCTDCSVLDLHLFRYKSTTFQYLPYCTACSHNFLSAAYKESLSWDKADLYFIKYTVAHNISNENHRAQWYLSCMKNSFLYNRPLSREVWLNIVYIILIWYKAELISPAHYHVHFQYQVKSKAECVCHCAIKVYGGMGLPTDNEIPVPIYSNTKLHQNFYLYQSGSSQISHYLHILHLFYVPCKKN